MEKRSCDHGEKLMIYLTGDVSDPDYAWVKEHIESCPACRRELRELEEVWQAIPFDMEEVEVPPDLKAEVMSAALGESLQTSDGVPEPVRPSLGERIRRWWAAVRLPVYRTAVVVLMAALGMVWWDNRMLSEQLSGAARPSAVPAQVVQVFTLAPADPDMASARGYVWVMQQGERTVLVFHVQALRQTKGTEAYQAWLIRDGKRTNAGVFVVDRDGNGLLTYELNHRSLPFDAIGITLEPDAHGSQPRGKKVLGTQL